MNSRPRHRLLAFLGVSLLLLFELAPLSADRPPDQRIRLRIPTAAAKGGHAVAGVELANDLRAQLRNRGGHINLEWRSSRGHGSLTRTADMSGMDATYDLAGLSSGPVSLTATLTLGADTIASSPVSTALFSLNAPITAIVQEGGNFAVTYTIHPDTVTLSPQPVTYELRRVTDGSLITSGSFPSTQFQPDGLGNLAATASIPVPLGSVGISTLSTTVGVLSISALGVPTTEFATASTSVSIQPAAGVPLVLTFVTPSGAHFAAGATATLEFAAQTQDPATTTGFCTIEDSATTPVASGTATLTVVDATHVHGTFTWAVPSSAAGGYLVKVLVQRGSGTAAEQTTGSLPITVDPVASVTLGISEPSPVMATAGQASTVHFTIRNLSSLAGAALSAVFTDRTSGAIVSASTIDPATLTKQVETLTGQFTFTFPPEAVAQVLDTNLTITLLINGGVVASAAVQVVIQPAPVPISVSVISAPQTATAGLPIAVTVGVSGKPVDQIASLSLSILDAAGNTVATENISPALLHAANSHLEATVQMNLSRAIPSGTYRLQVSMTTTGGQTFSASQPIQVTESVSLRFTSAAAQVQEGVEATIQAVLRPRVEVGGGHWFFLNGLGLVVPGAPAGTLAPSDFVAISDADGTPAWRVSISFTIPQGTVASPTNVSFNLGVTDTAGRVLVSGVASIQVQPSSGFPTITAVRPPEVLPLQEVSLEGTGFSNVLEQNRVLLYADGSPFEIRPARLSPLTFVVPADAHPGSALVAVVVNGVQSNLAGLRITSSTNSVQGVISGLSRSESDASLPNSQRRAARRLLDLLQGASGGRGNNGFVDKMANNDLHGAMDRLSQTAQLLQAPNAPPHATEYLRTLALAARSIAGTLLSQVTSSHGAGDPRVQAAQRLYDAALATELAGRFVEAIDQYDFMVDIVFPLVHPGPKRCQVDTEAPLPLCVPLDPGETIPFISRVITNPPNIMGTFRLDLFDLENDPEARTALQWITTHPAIGDGHQFTDNWDGLQPPTRQPPTPRRLPYMARARFTMDGGGDCQRWTPVLVLNKDSFRVDPDRARICKGKSKVFKALLGCGQDEKDVTSASTWKSSFKNNEAFLVNTSELKTSPNLNLMPGQSRFGTVRAHFEGLTAEAGVHLISKAAVVPGSAAICHANEIIDFDLYSCDDGVVDSEATWSFDKDPELGSVDDDGVFTAAPNLPPSGATGTITATWKGDAYTAQVKILPVNRIEAAAPPVACEGESVPLSVSLYCHGTLANTPVRVRVRDVSVIARFERLGLGDNTVGYQDITGTGTIVIPTRGHSDAPYDASLRVELAVGGLDSLFAEVDLTIVTVHMDIHNGQGGPTLASNVKYNVGAFTVANLNDTNNNHHPDIQDQSVTNAIPTRHEIDLMKVELLKPFPDLGGGVVLRVVSGDVKLWAADTKDTEIPLVGGAVTFPLSAGPWPKTVWIEARSPSRSVRDIELRMEYGLGDHKCTDRVRATAVWVERLSFRNAAGDGLSPDDDDANLRTTFASVGSRLGMTVFPLGSAGAPPVDFDNNVELGYTVLPAGVGAEPGVRFDVTQRFDHILQVVQDGVAVHTEHQTPVAYNETVNDENSLIVDDDNDPTHDHIFHIDGPGPRLANPADFPLASHFVVFEEGHYETFVRVRFDASYPAGEPPSGSRCSESLLWYAYELVEKASGSTNFSLQPLPGGRAASGEGHPPFDPLPVH